MQESPAVSCRSESVVPAHGCSNAEGLSPPIDFIVCGAQKCGTSGLHQTLSAHPQVLMGDTKELHHFDDEERFLCRDAGALRAAYHRRFPEPAPGKVRGEATPIYLWWEPAPARMHAYHPGLKLIVLLRCPLQRAFSQWAMQFSRGMEPGGFAEALHAELALGGAVAQDRVRSYLARGRYGGQLERLFRLFGREQVLVLRKEMLDQEPDQALARVQGFLGIPVLPLRMVRAHVSPVMPLPDPALQRWLIDYFRPEVEAVERLMGWNLAHWLRPLAPPASNSG